MVPVLIWEEDWCDVIPALQRLQQDGVTDFVAYFDANPEELVRIIKSVRVLGVNQTGARMFGAASGEELLAAFDELVASPGALRVFKKSLAAWAAGEREMEAESVNFDLYGRALHLLVKVALPDPDSGDTRVVLSEMDMTALRLADERFRIIAQATSDVVLDRDLISGSAWCSDGLFERFGHAPSVINEDVNAIFGLIHPDDRAAVETSLKHALEGSVERWKAQFRVRRADGSYAEVRERSIILRDDADRALRIIGSLVDLTEQTRLEDELRQSQRLDAIGQLTGGVAHDFNNLLTVILGNAEILSEAIKDERLRGLAEMCSAAALRGAELTSRLLAFARKQPLDPKRVDLNALILGLEGLLRRALGEQVDIELALSGSVGAAIADATQLESAVLNLCLNARDAMAQGGQLRIKTGNVDVSTDGTELTTGLVPGPYVVISVRDTGIGMDAATLARAVEPFFTTKEVGKGSGLGLSMVYGFAKQSRGHVEIISSPGAGTTVRLSLPRCQDESPSEEIQDPETPAPAGTETILLVEDDELVRAHVEAQLRSLGYAVVSVTTGTEALAALVEGHGFDLLFTDVVMPGGMSGLELAQHARGLCPDLPILFTSGYSEDHIGRHRSLHPGKELLRKPYRRQDLALAIRAVLDEGTTN
jgi:PAS domain S-box-containing protein